MSHLYTEMAELNRRIGQLDRAAILEAERRDLWRRWDLRLPNNSFVHRQLHAETHDPAASN
jgi:hypothetical protein